MWVLELELDPIGQAAPPEESSHSLPRAVGPGSPNGKDETQASGGLAGKQGPCSAEERWLQLVIKNEVWESFPQLSKSTETAEVLSGWAAHSLPSPCSSCRLILWARGGKWQSRHHFK